MTARRSESSACGSTPLMLGCLLSNYAECLRKSPSFPRLAAGRSIVDLIPFGSLGSYRASRAADRFAAGLIATPVLLELSEGWFLARWTCR